MSAAANGQSSPGARLGARPGTSIEDRQNSQTTSSQLARRSSESPSGPPSKRRRVTLACGNCRHRKSRCDGRRPTCSLCIELGCACVYEQAGVASNLTVGRSYLERLEKRLADIESSLDQVRAVQAAVPSNLGRLEDGNGGDVNGDDVNDENDTNDNDDGTDTGPSASLTNPDGSVTSSQAATTASGPPGTTRAPGRPPATATENDTRRATGGGFGEPDTAEDSIDGMGAIKFTDEEDWGYFGPSSNIAFLRHISLAMARMDDLNQAMPSPTNRAHEAVSGGMSVSRPRGGGSGPDGNGNGYANWAGSGGNGGGGGGTANTYPEAVNIYALPTEARTWSLIREYFQKTGRLLPFVHEATFYATYFAMKTSNFTKARRTWLGLLNIILAMAATLHVDTSVSAEKRIAESDVYYQRANGLCDKESRRNISVELVQYLLILGQYLQGTQKSVQAWTVHGLAITTALQLGLQSPKTNRAFSPLECEIRKRVWYGCVLLDRTLSMTFGRPSMIHESYLKLELPNIEMQIVGEEPPTAGDSHSAETGAPTPQVDGLYYRATIKLYNVMYRIIDTCYGQNLGFEDVQSDPAVLFSHVLCVETDLESWKAQLAHNDLSVYDAPVSPKDFEGVVADGKIAARYVVVLSVRYHNLQILLHRPILEKLLETCGRSSSSSLSSSSSSSSSKARSKLLQMGLSSVQACIHSAQAIISIVHTIVLSDGPRRDLLGAWNYSLFYTFNAALAIFAAMHIARCDVQAQLRELEHGSRAADSRQEQDERAKRLVVLLPRWEFVENALPYFGMAIEALENLDRGNRVVERCVSYLSQLALVPINPDGQAAQGGAAAGPALAGTSVNGGLHAHQAPHQHMHPNMPNIGGMVAPRQQQQLLPMEIDLNEFMLDTDFDLLNMAWLSS